MSFGCGGKLGLGELSALRLAVTSGLASRDLLRSEGLCVGLGGGIKPRERVAERDV